MYRLMRFTDRRPTRSIRAMDPSPQTSPRIIQIVLAGLFQSCQQLGGPGWISGAVVVCQHRQRGEAGPCRR